MPLKSAVARSYMSKIEGIKFIKADRIGSKRYPFTFFATEPSTTQIIEIKKWRDYYTIRRASTDCVSSGCAEEASPEKLSNCHKVKKWGRAEGRVLQLTASHTCAASRSVFWSCWRCTWCAARNSTDGCRQLARGGTARLAAVDAGRTLRLLKRTWGGRTSGPPAERQGPSPSTRSIHMTHTTAMLTTLYAISSTLNTHTFQK